MSTANDQSSGASVIGARTANLLDDVERDREFPVLGVVGVDGASSFLAAFGDSGCIDSGQLQHGSDCFFLLDRIRASGSIVAYSTVINVFMC